MFRWPLFSLAGIFLASIAQKRFGYLRRDFIFTSRGGAIWAAAAAAATPLPEKGDREVSGKKHRSSLSRKREVQGSTCCSASVVRLFSFACSLSDLGIIFWRPTAKPNWNPVVVVFVLLLLYVPFLVVY